MFFACELGGIETRSSVEYSDYIFFIPISKEKEHQWSEIFHCV